MSSIGQLIRHERLQRGMKQTALAEGICSASHLSKIENGTAMPSDEVIDRVLDKLEIRVKRLTEEEETELMDSLHEVYKEGVLKRDKEKIQKFLTIHSDYTLHFNHLHNFYTYHLLAFRLYLIHYHHHKDFTSLIEALSAAEDQFDQHQRFIFFVNIGLHDYFNYNFQDSLVALEKGLDIMKHVMLHDWEVSDFYSILGNTYHRNGENFSATSYTTKALNYYKENLLFVRALDCYILLGVSYRNLKQYKIARENYDLALKLATDFNLPYYKGMCYHNLGTLYSYEGNSEKALEYFHLSLETKQSKTILDPVLVTIHSLIIEYSKLHNSVLVLHWCQKGLEFIRQNFSDVLSTQPASYRFHFMIYQAIHSQTDDLESIVKEAIKHFEQVDNWRHVQKYSILLADHLFSKNKFKLAGEFYQKANNVLYKQKNVGKWEDL